MSYVSSGNFEKAKEPLEAVLQFAQNLGCEYLGTPSQCFLSVVLIAEGHFSQGMEMLENAQRWWLHNEAHWRYTFSELILGELFSAIARRSLPMQLSIIVRNLGFLVCHLPCAGRNAVNHYIRAIESAKKVGAQAMEGQAYLGLGNLYRRRGKKDKAFHCFSSAVQLFERCRAETFLRKAREALSLL